MKNYNLNITCTSCGIDLNIYNDEDGFWAVFDHNSVKTSVLSHISSRSDILIAGYCPNCGIWLKIKINHQKNDEISIF